MLTHVAPRRGGATLPDYTEVLVIEQPTWDEQAADRLATTAHEGQVDKAGHPYIEHPRRVRDRLQGSEARMTALLHDVLEDTGTTAEQLLSAGCPEPVVRAVQALTKASGEALEDAMRRVANDPLALEVKRADIADNSDPKRLALLPDDLVDRLSEKYRQSTALLDKWQPGANK